MISIGDFDIGGGRVTLRKTGNFARIDRRLLAEVGIWLVYHLIVSIRAFGRRIVRRPTCAIWFTPDVPHPRYMVRSAAIWAGIAMAKSAEEADAAFYFEDRTRTRALPEPHPVSLNFHCHDISKSHVARVFDACFGYPLAIDPLTWRGEAVEKSEENGTHDGRIVTCPLVPRAGKVYQRLIDTVDEDGRAVDLRTACVGGRPVIVWIKRRLAADRFLPPNLSVVRAAPEQIFSADERASIGRFTAAMGADWCGLDILRDADGRIYIVDLNKTDAGPIIALPLREKLASTALLARALRQLVETGSAQGKTPSV